jgi:hypothetical protein
VALPLSVVASRRGIVVERRSSVWRLERRAFVVKRRG